MKGRWLFFSALQAASRGISHTQRPPHRQFHSHTVAVRATGLFDHSFTRTVASPLHNDLHILHRCVSFSTAAAQRTRIICDKDEEARAPFVGLLATEPNQKQDEKAQAPTTKPKQKHDEVQARAPFVGLPATMPNQKPRVVVLGTGWGACRLLKELDTGRYDVVCISPRNHMVFTPLLASTCVGTLEFRSVAEPVRIIQPALAKDPDSYFFLARCTDIDTASHEVHCESVDDQAPSTTATFRIAYDKLVIATGAEATTFGIQGVHEYAIFLRDVQNAMAIRSKLMLNLMRCEIPGTDLQERKRLLHCVVVGGGPTGVEFSGELSDFILNDVQNKFAHVKDLIAVTLIEASDILSSFDIKLRQYATNHLTKSGVKLKRGIVKHVLATKLVLTDGTEVPYGLLVWSTGVGPSQFVKSLKQFEKSKNGRIGIDLTLRVPAHADVYAIGDCSGYLEGTGKTPLPALAQVAERQGKYLARALNKLGESGHARAGSGAPVGDPFVYKHLGSMATVGRYKALVDLRESPEKSGMSMTGFKSWLVWRSAYLTRVISWRARMYVAFNWGTTLLFGRDISRF